MQLSSVFLSLLFAAPFSVSADLSQGQINWYSDDNCQVYTNSGYPLPGEVIGGPAGSKSMMWILAPDAAGCSKVMPYFCKNPDCSASDLATLFECKSFENGVWGLWTLEC